MGSDEANDVPPEWLPAEERDTEPDENSVLRLFAEAEDNGLIEIGNGVWYMPKLRPDRDKLS